VVARDGFERVTATVSERSAAFGSAVGWRFGEVDWYHSLNDVTRSLLRVGFERLKAMIAITMKPIAINHLIFKAFRSIIR
jgi:hypothetical protein